MTKMNSQKVLEALMRVRRSKEAMKSCGVGECSSCKLFSQIHNICILNAITDNYRGL